MRLDGDSGNSNGSSRSFSNGTGKSPLHRAAVSNAANGTLRKSVAMNGSASTNGHTGKPKPSYYGHDREEVIRILIQSLTDLGYHGSAANLSQESGYELENPAVAAFRNAVLQGEWGEAEDFLFGGASEGGGVSIHGNGLVLQEGVDKNVMRFWLREQKFLELLEQRDTGRALMVLRSELTPLYQDTSKLHLLSSLLMCQSTEDLKRKAHWDGAEGDSRHRLLSELSKCISPSVMLPEHRLATLFQEVKRNQISNCLYHNTSTSPSLYQDHICDKSGFPMHNYINLERHEGEVWLVEFSHDGSRLASCGADGNTIIYETGSFDVLHILGDHQSGVGSLSWSPDDSMIVTGSKDRSARLWDARTGDLLQTLRNFGQPVSSSVWAPDGQTFVTSCLDTKRNLCQWNLNGELVYDWGHNHRIQDLAVSLNGRYLVAMEIQNVVHVYNFVTRELEYEIGLGGHLGSVAISQNSRNLLVNLLSGETHMFNIDTGETLRIFTSDKRVGQFIIRAVFGGANESFVSTGDEDGSIYVWHKDNGALVEKLPHGSRKGACSSISWNPANPKMFVSAGDDNKVRIWSDKDSALKYSPKATHQQHSSRSVSYGPSL